MPIGIQGLNFREVFRNAANDRRFDEIERTTASAIADDLDAEAAYDDRARMRDFDYRTSPSPPRRYRLESPFSDAGRGAEVVVFTLEGSDVRFTVRQYTAGPGMNVGVDR